MKKTTTKKLISRNSSFKLRYAVAGIVVAIGLGVAVASIFAAGPAQVSSVAVEELGQIMDPSATFITRDGGASAILGGKVLWTFGDTIFPRKSVGGVSGYSSTAGYADITSPTKISEPLDANGVPSAALLPLTSAETLYNVASGDPSERYALWPTQVIPESPDSALIMFTRLKVHPGGSGLNYELLGDGFARIKAGETTANRLNDNFWPAPGPYFNQGHMQVDGFDYFYSCSHVAFGVADCKTARTPVGKILDRAAYNFWNGKDWGADITKAVASTPGSTSGFSIAYNQYLKSYAIVYSTGFSKNIIMRTSPNPQGPWSYPVNLYTAPSYVYATDQHPELSPDSGRTLFISYYRPEEKRASGIGHALQLMKVTLNPNTPNLPDGNPPPSVGNPSSPGSGGQSTSTSASEETRAASLSAGVNANGEAQTRGDLDSQSSSSEDAQKNQTGFWARVWDVLLLPWRWFSDTFL